MTAINDNIQIECLNNAKMDLQSIIDAYLKTQTIQRISANYFGYACSDAMQAYTLRQRIFHVDSQHKLIYLLKSALNPAARVLNDHLRRHLACVLQQLTMQKAS